MPVKEDDDEIVIRELTYNVDEIEEEITETDWHTEPEFKVPDKCKIIKDGFGLYRGAQGDDSKVVHRYTLINKNNIMIQVITYGATVTSIKTPDKNGHFDDIVMGFDNFEDYRSLRNPYFGATIGRVTGVIPQREFSIFNQKYLLSNNFMNNNHANGGFIGFDKVIWNANILDGKLCLSYMSKDNEEGFPGDVVVNRLYDLTNDDELVIETSAHCSRCTPVDISTHIDWNLSSHLAGPKELYKHYLMVNGDKYAQIDKKRLLTGKLKNVGNTVLDLRVPRPLGRIIHRVPGGGYDHYFHLIRGSDQNCVTFAAKLTHPETGRFVDLMSNQPGVCVYTQNNLYADQHIIEAHPISCWCYDPYLISEKKRIKNPSDVLFQNRTNPCKKIDTFGPINGKFGAGYQRHGGIRIVPSNYPEPVTRYYNLDAFLLCPGETYVNTSMYKFGNTFDKQYDPLGKCHVEDLML